MRRLLRDESGFTLPELVVVTFVTVILMAGLSNLFVSGLRTSATTGARLSNQSNTIVVLSRLEFDARCASSAVRVSSGAGVTLTLPSNCPHATGTETWCVTSGKLVRYSGSSACSGTSQQVFASDVTSATPFSCVATVGDYPELQIALTVRAGASGRMGTSTTERIAMHNAPLTTSTSAGCS